jgi:hypothetical protein
MKTGNIKKTAIKIIGINITLFLLLFGLVDLNKTVFRPAFNETPFEQMLTGSFPTFIAAFLISLCAVNPVLIRRPRSGRLIVYLASLLVLTVLILDEMKSIGASQQFDIYDITGAVLGTLLAVLTFEYLYYRQKGKKRNSDTA